MDSECHLTRMNAGGTIYIINENGLEEVEGRPTGRGTSVFLQYYLEETMEYFETQLQFRKGSILKTTGKIGKERLGLFDTTLESVNDAPLDAIASGDIWRD